MEIRVLNPSFVALDIIESFESMIWTERYSDLGDFELVFKYEKRLEDLLLEDNYLIMSDSERVMIIETVIITTDPETGNKLVVKGRSLESILDRRIVLRQILIDTSFQSGVQAILNEDVINGTYPERNFPNFIFSTSSDPLVTGLNLKAQYYSENLFLVIKALCKNAGLGFKIVLNSTNQFVFSLYSGHDRSYTQLTNPYIVFSPEFDNLIKSDYYRSKQYLKTYALTSGDPTSAGSGLPIRGQSFTGVQTGLDRREMFVDASDMSKFLWNSSTEIADAVYQEQLVQRGYEELALNTELTVFDGSVDLSRSYKYGVDFFLGDIIQMVDNFGHSARAQILEMTFSQNLSGSTTYPTLKTI